MKNLNIYLLYPVDVSPEKEDIFFEKIACLREGLAHIPEVTLVENSDDADLCIVMLEHYPESFTRCVVDFSQSDRVMWGFTPRSVRVPRLISDEILEHASTQELYPYDTVEEIERLVARKIS